MNYLHAFLRCFLIAAFAALSQPVLAQAQAPDDFVDKLVAENQDRESLIDQHRGLVTRNLWEHLVQRAAWSYSFGNPGQSVRAYEAAAVVADRIGDARLLAIACFRLGEVYSGLGQTERAIEAYLRSRDGFAKAESERDLIYILADLGTLYLISGDREKARDYSEQSLALADKLGGGGSEIGTVSEEYGVAKAKSNLGNLGVLRGEYDQASDQLRAALDLYRRLAARAPQYAYCIADCLADIGHVLSLRGDNIQALTLLNEALGLARAYSDEGRAAYVLNSLGILYLEQEDYDKAVECLGESLRIYSARNNGLEVARVRQNIGVAYLRQGAYAEALARFKEVLQATPDADIAAAAEQNIGAVYRALGEYDQAMEWLNKSTARAKALGDPVRVAEALWRQAEVRYAKGDYDASAALAKEAATLAREHNLVKHSYLALTALGRAYRTTRDYEQAYAALQQAIRFVERLRDTAAGGEEGRRKFLENSIAPYREMFLLLAEQGKVREAFGYAERAKGRVLLDVLRGGRTDAPEAALAAEREQAQTLRREVFRLNDLIVREQRSRTPDKAEVTRLAAQLKKARSAYDDFWARARLSTSPEERRRRGEVDPVTEQQLAALIPDDKSAVLEYVVTEKKAYLLVVVAKRVKPIDGRTELDMRAYPLAISGGELDERVALFRTRLASRQILPETAYSELYDVLIKPAEQQLAGRTTLCVVPDGALWKLPFQALKNKGKYLVEDYAVFYAPSVGVLRETMEETRRGGENTSAGRELLAFANPSTGGGAARSEKPTGRGKAFTPLPLAEDEVRDTGRFFDPARSRIYTGAEAREGRAKSEAGAYAVLHFATHAALDDRDPMYSYLVLAQGGEAGREDGLLEAREIMNLNLRARLVVLSACETGLGRYSAGEGTIGMTWAFFVAGAPSTLASLWSVESASTSRLMVEFHRQLASAELRSKGVAAKAVALQKAQLSLLQGDRFDHPFYWSGFSLYGDPR